MSGSRTGRGGPENMLTSYITLSPEDFMSEGAISRLPSYSGMAFSIITGEMYAYP